MKKKSKIRKLLAKIKRAKFKDHGHGYVNVLDPRYRKAK